MNKKEELYAMSGMQRTPRIVVGDDGNGGCHGGRLDNDGR